MDGEEREKTREGAQLAYKIHWIVFYFLSQDV